MLYILAELSNKDQIEDEKRRLQEAVRDLQSQLSRSSAAVSDLGDVRKELDRSERQRTQLSDHIEVIYTLFIHVMGYTELAQINRTNFMCILLTCIVLSSV